MHLFNNVIYLYHCQVKVPLNSHRIQECVAPTPEGIKAIKHTCNNQFLISVDLKMSPLLVIHKLLVLIAANKVGILHIHCTSHVLYMSPWKTFNKSTLFYTAIN